MSPQIVDQNYINTEYGLQKLLLNERTQKTDKEGSLEDKRGNDKVPCCLGIFESKNAILLPEHLN